MIRFLATLLALLFALPATAQIAPGPKVHVRLIAERDAVEPGGTVTVAVEQAIRPGWHSYWINAGEAGAPTEVHWTLPSGWKAGDIQWPYPQAETVGPIMDYGYEGKPWLLVNVTAPKDAKPGDTVTLKAVVNMLVCAEVCVPEDATVTLPLTVGEPTLPPDPAFAMARAKLPAPSPWPMRYRLGDALDLFVEAPSLAAAHPAKAEFFPFESGMLKKGVWPQETGYAQSGLVQRLQPGPKLKGVLAGVLVLTSADGSVQALNVNAMPGPVPDVSVGGGGDAVGLLLALGFAFLGGLILNLMPCVLPILAMKALALSSHGGGGAHARQEGLAYGAGAAVSFLVLGAAVIILRAGGNAIGWGFQLQEPIVVGAFALLMFAVGLNLSGVFELPGFGGGDTLARKGGMTGAFFTGVLAVAVAAPCTAPFMAAALGYALTQPAVLSLAVFFALGIGFAAPFILIGFSPRILKLIPAPGAWMLRLKQVLAFPMYGAAAWLVWVLTNEVGAIGVVAALGAMVCFALAAWVWTTSRNAAAAGRGFGAFATLVAFIAALGFLSIVAFSAPATPEIRAADSGIPHEPYTAARLEALRKENRPVFINATAAWCITCLVNERVAFSGDTVRDAFAKHHVACLIADWTSRNPEITKLLEEHGRDGVPLYLYYAPGSPDAKILPQILTADDVVKAVGG